MLELESRTQTTKSQIDDLEKRIGVSLPDDYRRFLISQNGGRCVSGGVLREMKTGEKVSRVRRLLGVSSVSYESIEQSLSDLVTRMPSGLVPIGEDSGGNCVLIDCSGSQTRGSVYFLDLERASDENPPSRGDLPLLAISFSQLLSQLEEE